MTVTIIIVLTLAIIGMIAVGIVASVEESVGPILTAVLSVWVVLLIIFIIDEQVDKDALAKKYSGYEIAKQSEGIYTIISSTDFKRVEFKPVEVVK